MAPTGPDVSLWQGTVDWTKVAGSSDFAACKATEGTTTVDPKFKQNWKGIKSAGIPVRIAYHFGHPGSSATAQAKHFVSTVGTFRAGDMAMLDIEISDGVSALAVASWCKAWCDYVAKLTGLPKSRILVYTGAWFWDPSAGGSKVVSGHPLWVAAYVPSNPPIPKGWTSWTFWQYTSTGKISGVSTGVDISRFNGTLVDLHTLAAVTPPTAKSTKNSKPPVHRRVPRWVRVQLQRILKWMHIHGK